MYRQRRIHAIKNFPESKNLCGVGTGVDRGWFGPMCSIGPYNAPPVGVGAYDDPIGTAIDADRRGVQGAAPYNSE